MVATGREVAGKPFAAEYEHVVAPRSSGERQASRGRFWRDGRGRMRQVCLTGSPGPGEPPPQVAVLTDLGERIFCFVDAESGSVIRKISFGEGTSGRGDLVCPTSRAARAEPTEPTVERLGEMEMEGLRCAGHRIKATGSTTDMWVAIDLETPVLERVQTADGERLFRLFNIELGEPDASLFEPLDQ